MNQAYQLNFRSIGHDVIIWPRAKVVRPERITIGDAVIIDDFVYLDGGANSEIGSFVHIAVSSSICGGGELVMEDFSGISGGVRIYTGSDDFTGGSIAGAAVPYPYRQPERTFVHIGRFVVIGANSVVLPGVTIGEGAAVGASSVVTRDLKPWTIYVGQPARPIGPRPSHKILELEKQLRHDLYDVQGHYIPKERRE